MQNWQFANGFRKATHALAAAAAIVALLASGGRASAQDLSLPQVDSSSLSFGSGGSSSSGATAGTGAVPGMGYPTENYYPADSGGAYYSGGVTYSELLGAHVRARYNTRSYGQTRGNLNLGTMKLFDQGDSAWFIDGQVVLNDENPWGYNLGVGYRFLTLPMFNFTADEQKVAGLSVWTDGMMTSNDNFLPQVGVSMEYLGEYWDVRGNVYIPIADTEIGEVTGTGFVGFQDTFLVQEVFTGVDEALTVGEVEVARRLGELDAWAFVGGYGLTGDTIDAGGYRLGLRGYAMPDVSLQLAVTDDEEFGTNLVFSGTWFIGRTRTSTPCRSPVEMRMRDPVLRNDYVAIRQSTITDGEILEGDIDGDGEAEPIRVVHVDSTAADGGDGSIDSPLNELSDIDGAAASTTDSIVLVHSGSTFGNGVTLDGAVLKDGQRLLGEGGSVDHMVNTTRFGTISLPESSTGASAGAIPTITNPVGGGDVITLANETIEVNNLVMTGGTRAIVSPSGTAGATLTNLSITGTSGNAIELTPGSAFGTPGDASTQFASFSPLISSVTFANIGGDDINLDGTATALASPSQEQITISDVTSTGGQGMGIVLANTTSGATVTDYSHDGGGASTGGILVSNDGSGDGSVAVTNATITNQGGFGILLDNSNAGHTFSNVTIIDTAGVAFDVNDGPNNNSVTTTFTGLITQSQNATAVRVRGGHLGTINFSEQTAGAGVVNAINGDGLQFNDADGTYFFTDGVTLAGGDAAIDIVNDSAGNISILDGTITNPTGIAVNVADSTAGLSFTGLITQENAVETVLVTNHSAGTLAFNERNASEGSINATNGDGLRFVNADGGYNFNGGVTLNGTTNGADTALDIMTDSDGQFTFADASITNPTGVAVNVDGGGSSMTLNYTGMVTQSNNAAALSVTGGNEGTIDFLANSNGDASITATNGPGLVFDDANGSYRVAGELNLNGMGVTATRVSINNSDGQFTFDDATITGSTDTSLLVNGGAADVTFTGLITHSSNSAAIEVASGHTGTMTFSEATNGAGVVNATDGTGLDFNNADGVYLFNDAVTLNGGDASITITNGSSGTFNFDADSAITNPTGDAFTVENSNASVVYSGTIDNNAGFAASIVGNSGGSVTLGGQITGTGSGIQVLNNTGGGFNFSGGANLQTGNNDAVTLGSNSGTTIGFSNLQIDNSAGTGRGFVAVNSVGVSVTGANNTIDTGAATALDLNNVTVGAGGMNFLSVSSTGAASGIVMNDVDGGPVTIGGGTTAGDGGTIAGATASAVSLTNVANVTIRFMDLSGAAANGVSVVNSNASASTVNVNNSTITGSGARGIDVSNTGAGAFRVTIDNNTLNTSTAESIAIDASGSASTSNITVSNNSVTNTSADEALLITGSTGIVNLLIDANDSFASTSANGSVDITASGTSSFNTTITDNQSFSNTVGDGLSIENAAAGASVRLAITGNAATGGGANTYHLTNNGGNFSIENRSTAGMTPDETNTPNGSFLFDGANAFTDDAGGIPTP